MRKLVAVLSIFSFILSACSTHQAYINYNEFKGDMPIKDGSWNSESLGQVRGEDGGAVWNNCTEKARGSVREMIAQAKMRGANAIGDVRWTASGTNTPTCKKGWGWVMLWPFLLTPLFMSTEVRGTAYKVSGKVSHNGLWNLPVTQEGEDDLINKILAQSN